MAVVSAQQHQTSYLIGQRCLEPWTNARQESATVTSNINSFYLHKTCQQVKTFILEVAAMAGLQPKDILKEKAKAKKDRSEQMKRRENTQSKALSILPCLHPSLTFHVEHAQSLAAIIPEPDKKQTFTQFSEHDVRAQTTKSQGSAILRALGTQSDLLALGHAAETAQPAREREPQAHRAPELEPEREPEAQPTPTSSEIAGAETSGKAL